VTDDDPRPHFGTRNAATLRKTATSYTARTISYRGTRRGAGRSCSPNLRRCDFTRRAPPSAAWLDEERVVRKRKGKSLGFGMEAEGFVALSPKVSRSNDPDEATICSSAVEHDQSVADRTRAWSMLDRELKSLVEPPAAQTGSGPRRSRGRCGKRHRRPKAVRAENV